MSTTLHWNTVLMELSRRDHSQGYAGGTQGGPTRTSRAMAITHLAIYNAVMAKVHLGRYAPGFGQAPQLNTSDLLTDLIDGAASCTLKSLYHRQTQLIDEATSSSNTSVGFIKGQHIATAILKVRNNDKNFLGNGTADSTESILSYGKHKVDPFDPTQVALSDRHGDVPRFCSKQRPALGLFPGCITMGGFPSNLLANKEYRTDYEDVYKKGALVSITGSGTTSRTPEEKLIGIFWGYDGAQGLGVPPRLYNQIVRIVMNDPANISKLEPDAIEVEHATLLAKVHLAMADAGIDAWYYKYKFNLWRPVVGIRNETHTVGKARPDIFWAPLGAPQTNQEGRGPRTPGFPAYPSGHATFGAAMFQVLSRHFDNEEIKIKDVLKAVRVEPNKKPRFCFVSDELDGIAIDADGSVRNKSRPRVRQLRVRDPGERRVTGVPGRPLAI